MLKIAPRRMLQMMASPKSRAKSRDPFNGAPLIPGNPGNSGGKKGRSGRPPLDIKVFWRDVLEDPKTQDAIRHVAADPTNRNFGAIIKLAYAYSQGLPSQTITHEGAVTLTHEERRQRLASFLESRIGLS